jgi:hypothetical protein
MQKLDVTQTVSSFLEKIEPKKFPDLVDFLIECFGDYTLENFMKMNSERPLKYRGFGKISYVRMCEIFKEAFVEIDKWPVFALYEQIKNHKRLNLPVYTKQRRTIKLQGLIDELKKKAPGFVSNDAKFLKKLGELEKMLQ